MPAVACPSRPRVLVLHRGSGVFRPTEFVMYLNPRVVYRTVLRRSLFLLLSGAGSGCVGTVEGPSGPADNAQPGEAVGSGAPGTTPDPGPFKPAPAGLRRLLAWEYRNAVGDLLGTPSALAVSPPEDFALSGFQAIAASELALPAPAVEAYETSARAAAKAVVNLPGLMGCVPTAIDDQACLRSFLQRWGRRAWRRVLTTVELDEWTAAGLAAARDYGSFDAGARAAISGFLQAPSFLYQVRVGIVDPSDRTRRKLTGEEVATRMSFFLAGSTPTEALLDAGARGDLGTPDGIRTHARMLLAARGTVGLGAFFSEYLGVEKVAEQVKDPALFPKWKTTLATAMATETRMLVEDLVFARNADTRELLSASYTFVNPELAAFYGLPPPALATAFSRVDLPLATRRGGILGHGTFLTQMAHRQASSPTLRGKFVRDVLLCQAIPAPPDDVDTTLKPTLQNATTRDRLAHHMAEPACRGCHALMDPIGFGLENFDAIGGFRTTESGLPVNGAGTLDGKDFAGAHELGVILRDMPEVPSCLFIHLYRHASGHLEQATETRVLREIEGRFASSGYKVQDLAAEIAASDTMRTFTPPEGMP